MLQYKEPKSTRIFFFCHFTKMHAKLLAWLEEITQCTFWEVWGRRETMCCRKLAALRGEGTGGVFLSSPTPTSACFIISYVFAKLNTIKWKQTSENTIPKYCKCHLHTFPTGFYGNPPTVARAMISIEGISTVSYPSVLIQNRKTKE